MFGLDCEGKYKSQLQASMTRHPLCVCRPSKGCIHIKLRLEDVMADYSSNDSRDNKIGLERWFQGRKAREMADHLRCMS
jgi:hypothetical protein